MATERAVNPRQVVKERESTRQILCDCPYDGPNMLHLSRETVELDVAGNVVRVHPWRCIQKTAAEIAIMIFTRADGTKFTGLQLMADIQEACDQIAAEG